MGAVDWNNLGALHQDQDLRAKAESTLARALWRSASARLENGKQPTALRELEASVAMAEKLLLAENLQLAEYRDTLRQGKTAIESQRRQP